MRRLVRIYTRCVGTAWKMVSAYRINFIISTIITLLGNILFPLVTLLIYQAGSSFPGWNLYEVLLVQSIFTISSGMASMFFANVLWETMNHVRNGSFEIVLLKPLNPIFYLIATNFSPDGIGLVIGGGILFGIAVAHTGIGGIAAVLLSVVLFLAGFAVMTGVNMLMAAVSFRWIGNSRIPEIFDSLLAFGRYPGGIFPVALQAVMTFLLPVGMIGFYPAACLLGRMSDNTYANGVFWAVIPCFLFMFVGIWTYRHMIRDYEGVGG